MVIRNISFLHKLICLREIRFCFKITGLQIMHVHVQSGEPIETKIRTAWNFGLRIRIIRSSSEYPCCFCDAVATHSSLGSIFFVVPHMCCVVPQDIRLWVCAQPRHDTPLIFYSHAQVCLCFMTYDKWWSLGRDKEVYLRCIQNYFKSLFLNFVTVSKALQL